MNILHVGSVANVPQTLCNEWRKLEYYSDVISFEQKENHKIGIDFYYPMDYSIISRIKKLYILAGIIPDYDLVHFHYSTGLPFGLDLPLWKDQQIVMHFHGDDIRGKKVPRMIKKYADFIYVSTPDLLEYASNCKADVLYIPNPIDLDDYKIIGTGVGEEKDTINIVHAPSDRARKGTEWICRAIDRLRGNGFKINFNLVENMNHWNAVEYYKSADIIIDQLLVGWYGMVAIEGMALGKPVCCYIRDDLLDKYDPQVVNINKDNLYENLKSLIQDYDFRREIGMSGRRYAEKYHDSRKVVKMLYR